MRKSSEGALEVCSRLEMRASRGNDGAVTVRLDAESVSITVESLPTGLARTTAQYCAHSENAAEAEKGRRGRGAEISSKLLQLLEYSRARAAMMDVKRMRWRAMAQAERWTF
jgi:hypothetical protein